METQSKFVTYLRVSTDKQEESGLGLDAQLRAIQDFTKDGEVIGSFTEIESRSNNDRPQIKLAIDLARKHKATLVVAKHDRLTGDSLFINQLLASDVKFKCVDNPDATPFTLRLFTAFAQEEVEKIRSRSKDAQTSIQKIIERDGFYVAKKTGRVITKRGNPTMQDKSKAKEHCQNMLKARSYSKKDPIALELVKSLALNGKKPKDIIASLDQLHIKISPRTVYNYLS
jgi:DNA invertase Pin-like site-specific DNA recombinase